MNDTRSPMAKFTGIKSLATIKQQCVDAGIEFDDSLATTTGSDFIVIRSIRGDSHSGEVLFNSVNGNFFGTTPDGVQFDSRNTTHEHEEWFQALLNFFYTK